MEKQKVIVCDHIHEAGLELLKADDKIEMIFAADMDKTALLDVVATADVAITRSSTDVDAKFINAAKNSLKAIVRAGVGVDNVDIPGCSKEGIIVMNVPTANTIAAVELTMTHMLSCMRMFPYSHDHLKNQRIWKREKWYGHELKGKKLGIIGFGNIGSRVGIRSKAFEMDVIAYDPYITAAKCTDLGVEYTTNFEDILACDIITIHTPKNPETLDMINTKEIEKMKDGVVLINCARGGLYNEDALYDGCKSGKVRFAGIDVFIKEPATDNRLLDLDNICVSPHLGANTFESQLNIGLQAAQQAIEAAKGISYPNAFNLPIDESTMPAFVKPFLEMGQKVGFLASQMNRAHIRSIKVSASGEIANYLDSLETFVSVGAMSSAAADNINYVNAAFVLEERGVKISSEVEPDNHTYKNVITVKITTEKDVISISATIFNDTVQRIVDINGFDLDVVPHGNMILFQNTDVPGVIGNVGILLSKHNVNISDFRLGRDDKSQALAVIIVDSEVTDETLKELEALEACISVDYARI
ncbi:MAG: phosphoglycerate dehydrogenase [Helicobacteraceae bacterium]|nr:phosphoglycerate dehydrogenase [Helicobacteraceae bacterium]